MKHTFFSRKAIILSTVLLAIILFGTFYFVVVRSTVNTGNEDNITYAEAVQKQKYDKEIELKEILGNFDKENIVETWVFLGDSDNEITHANILIVGHEKIIDSSKKDALMSLASESLNLDIQNIDMEYMDVETFTSKGK